MIDKETKRDIKTIAIMSKKHSYDNPATLDKIISYAERNKLFESVYGRRFIERIAGIAYGNADSATCILCGQNIAENGVVCDKCIDKVSKSHTDSEQKSEANTEENTNEPETTAERSNEEAAILESLFDDIQDDAGITDAVNYEEFNSLDNIDYKDDKSFNIWKITTFILALLLMGMSVLCLFLLFKI